MVRSHIHSECFRVFPCMAGRGRLLMSFRASLYVQACTTSSRRLRQWCQPQQVVGVKPERYVPTNSSEKLDPLGSRMLELLFSVGEFDLRVLAQFLGPGTSFYILALTCISRLPTRDVICS